jgi:co-chaperonin GroES (HSP10)
VKVRPLRDQILIERLEGHGIETVSPGGIIFPATIERRAEHKRDGFRARVEAVGPDVRELEPGEHVLVHTWTGDDGSKGLYVGRDVGNRKLLVKPDDIICVVAADAHAEVLQQSVAR